MIQADVFGDRFLAREFSLKVREELVEAFLGDETVHYETVIWAYANLETGHKVLKLLVDTHCSSYKAGRDRQQDAFRLLRDKLPHRFLLDVMERYAEVGKVSKRDRLVWFCDYHDHKSEDEKLRCPYYCDPEVRLRP
jgi:hypothetical protein